jgi:hypothetical protein
MKIVGNTPGFHGDEFDDARTQTSLVPARYGTSLAIEFDPKSMSTESQRHGVRTAQALRCYRSVPMSTIIHVQVTK